eukprot:CAMPEP_0195519038 /NCGR_PEP_ID=MMETSP0794_2-20130614/14245_1 /TAXON_ID=515487 /ORGANISM="Stephanopyxis turris, Strain CCMP 815" /LENGTH=451 /DNA_ID=CAMNT_0040648117 /DNA_START=27 /DNA_END=1382 /DNA_ORIENTATION=+
MSSLQEQQHRLSSQERHLEIFASHLGTVKTYKARLDDDCSSISSSTESGIDDLLDSLPCFEEKRGGICSKQKENIESETPPSTLIINSCFSKASTNGNQHVSLLSAHSCEDDGACICTTSLCNSLTTKENERLTCSFPSLFLDTHYHEHECSSSSLSSPKKQRKLLEHTAACHLDRPLLVKPKDANSTHELYESSSNNVFQEVEEITEIPSRLLSNFSGSFSSLIDARLRAYAMILLRHALTNHNNHQSPEIKKKLLALLEIGENIAIDAVVTSFNVNTQFFEEGNCEDAEKYGRLEESGPTDVLTLPIVFEAVIDVCIPYYNSKIDPVILTVLVCAPGSISGIFEHEPDYILRGVHVKLDTNILLESMIEQARCVALEAVNNLNLSTASSSSYSCPIVAHEDEQAQSNRCDLFTNHPKEDKCDNRNKQLFPLQQKYQSLPNPPKTVTTFE